jgi:hypothetical protein
MVEWTIEEFQAGDDIKPRTGWSIRDETGAERGRFLSTSAAMSHFAFALEALDKAKAEIAALKARVKELDGACRDALTVLETEALEPRWPCTVCGLRIIIAGSAT